MGRVVLEDVWKRYPDGTEAVKQLDLQIEDGEFLVLVGPSGCGKSTALRMIAGLEEISDGKIEIGGRVVNDLSPKERDIAMVFQSYALYPHMTVFDNMAFALRLSREDRGEIERRVHEAAAVLDLAEHLHRKPSALSGGQRQRVAMGRAIVRAPQAFLMDEPLSNLDAKLRVQMRAEIAALQARLGITTVYVTHDQIEAMTMADRVAVLRRGVLQQVDRPDRLYEEPANLFVAGFVGSPAMNLGLLDLSPGQDDEDLAAVFLPQGNSRALPATVLARHSLARARAGDTVAFGVRPEHVELVPPDDPAAAAPGEVRLVEQLGAEMLVHVETGIRRVSAPSGEDLADDDRGGTSLTVVARLEPGTPPAIGDHVGLAFRQEALHLFDAATGRALRPDTAGDGGAA